MKLPSQSSLFWQAHCEVAAENHRKMAAMQRAAGNLRLAHDSERNAKARDLAREEMIRHNTNLARALDYGDWRAKQSV